MAGKRPTQRTLEYLRERGYTVEVVEKYIPYAGIRKDFLSCIDIIAMKKGEKIIGVQCFSTAWTEHRKKIVEDFPEGTKFWLSLGYTELWFFGWRKLKVKRGGKAFRYMARTGQLKTKGKKRIKLIEKPFHHKIK